MVILLKEQIIEIINKYLEIYPDELKRQQDLIDFVNRTNYEGLVDWNNFDAHLVASVFLYAKDTKRFASVYHMDFKVFLYPGGHMDQSDESPLSAAIRELEEETGIINPELIDVYEGNSLIPIDIDKHDVPKNDRVHIPSHNHYDFRYLMCIDHEVEIKLDTEELNDYKWIDLSEFNNKKMEYSYKKIKNIIDK